MGLEKPVISGNTVVENKPFTFTEKGVVETSSSFSFTAYDNTDVEPLSLTVSFTADKTKFYMVKEDDFIAFGSTAGSNSATVYFHLKKLTSGTKSISLYNCTVYECDY